MTSILHIVLARKPVEGTVADNCLVYGTGALNIDGCRIAGIKEGDPTRFLTTRGRVSKVAYAQDKWTQEESKGQLVDTTTGRWPANLILDIEIAKVIDKQAGKTGGAKGKRCCHAQEEGEVFFGQTDRHDRITFGYNDSGSASRFFFNFTEQESDE